MPPVSRWRTPTDASDLSDLSDMSDESEKGRRHLGGVPVVNGESLGRGPVVGTATGSQLV